MLTSVEFPFAPHVNGLLNPSLVVAVKCSFPITFLLSDENCNEILQGQRDTAFSRNCQGSPSSRFGRHTDLLLTFNAIFTACKPQTFSSCFQELLLLHAFLLQFWCKTRALVTFIAKVKGVVFQKNCFGGSFPKPLSLLISPISLSF